MNIDDFFAVPLARIDDPRHMDFNPALWARILAMEAAGDKHREVYRRDTQHGLLFESQWELFYREDACFRELADFCNRSLASLVHRISSFDETEFRGLRWHYDAWFHVTRKGGYQGLHNHPNASWSGIYRVDPGGSSEDTHSGVVRLHDPLTNAYYYSDPGNARLKSVANIGGIDVWHHAGQLVLFPSYLMHEIFAYSGEGPRIVVAFNARVSAGS